MMAREEREDQVVWWTEPGLRVLAGLFIIIDSHLIMMLTMLISLHNCIPRD